MPPKKKPEESHSAVPLSAQPAAKPLPDGAKRKLNTVKEKESKKEARSVSHKNTEQK